MGMQDELSLLQATNAQVSMLDSGCCGMAGPFGFEKDKYEVSQALGERVLLPAVRSAAPETILVYGWLQLPGTDTAEFATPCRSFG